MRRTTTRVAALLVTSLTTTGCATLSQIRALEDVDFSIQRVSEVRLAGVDLSDVQAFGDLGLAEVAILADAVRQRDLLLAMEVEVLAENPADNVVDARLVEMTWTLFLQDRETVSGQIVGQTVLPRGEPTVVPVIARLNLVDFFQGSTRDLVDLVLSVTGLRGESTNVTLRALPVVETVFGPITYERPIRIVSVDVGG